MLQRLIAATYIAIPSLAAFADELHDMFTRATTLVRREVYPCSEFRILIERIDSKRYQTRSVAALRELATAAAINREQQLILAKVQGESFAPEVDVNALLSQSKSQSAQERDLTRRNERRSLSHRLATKAL